MKGKEKERTPKPTTASVLFIRCRIGIHALKMTIFSLKKLTAPCCESQISK